MSKDFDVISDVIKRRRTIKPSKMNGRIIPNEQVQQLLELADWAPTHKHTEPWRFLVYSEDSARKFVSDHAELYRKSVSENNFNNDKYEKILGNGQNISHIVVCIMKRDPQKRLPEIEEIAAASAAVQNILLGATALGIANFWSTGGMTHSELMKEHLGLNYEDILIGLIYLGYSESNYEGKRTIPLEEKITWK
ncbi:MAG TPA: nitroreductase [Ignavibacteria bacterium]|nr:nitroreductase [Bacteroidota bacterium]HRE10569.1 nitroreductase [Ignavibacteria bacterium]HRF64856.1 nitroreductase [Ignavibacteria bacterium]HRJ04764.1 nitroreductase [Ignavibacteria bacterium]